jgi:predicted PurR-regulated permease PerM
MASSERLLPKDCWPALGFWIAGVEQALLLGFLTFVLSFLPAGPPFVWGGVAIWLVVQGDFWWGMFAAAWGALLVSTIDNLLRPYLLSQSNNLPVVSGLFGFVGGILAFGFIGIFLGPAFLAVGYSFFLEWANAPEGEAEQGDRAQAPGDDTAPALDSFPRASARSPPGMEAPALLAESFQRGPEVVA